MRSLAILTLVVSCVLPTADAQTAVDTSAVRQAVLDYAYALYRIDPALVDRSVSRDLVKVGVYAGDDGLGRVPMSFDQLRGLAATWNEGGRQVAPDAEPARVAVLDVLDRTATARLSTRSGAWTTSTSPRRPTGRGGSSTCYGSRQSRPRTPRTKRLRPRARHPSPP